jgi:uncharacterized membrane protein
MFANLQIVFEKVKADKPRWLCFVVFILFAASVALLQLPLNWAIWIHAYMGYFFCAIVLALFAYFTFRVLRTCDLRAFARNHRIGLAVVLLASVFVQCHQPQMMRVFNDEPAHQMVGKIMHEERENSVPEVGYYLEGDLVYGERSLNYRMYFYPFLVSIIHDLSGFRVENGVRLNAGLGAILFLSVYLGGNRIYQGGGGVLAVLLFAGLPLLDLSVTSYGYDTANLLSLSVFFLALCLYAERRDSDSLNWLIAVGLTLAYCRNESVIYLFAMAVLVAYVFAVSRTAKLTWIASFSPLLLLPILAARQIFNAANANLSEMFTHLDSNRFFAMEFIPKNFSRVGEWLFDLSTLTPSYPLLSILGTIGLVTLISTLAGDVLNRKKWRAIDSSLLLFSTVVLASFVFITLALFWNPVAGEAVRFLLPLHLAFTYASVWLLSRATNANFWMPVFILIAICGIFFVGIPSKMRDVGGANIVFGNYAKWSLDWLAERDDANTLYISQLNTLFLLHDYPVMDLNRANENERKVIQLEVEKYYSRIVVFVIERYDVKTGRWSPPSPAPLLSERFVTKVIDERRWSYNQRARFLEVTAYREDSGEVLPIDGIPSMKYDFDTFNSYWSAMRKLHPGLDR